MKRRIFSLIGVFLLSVLFFTFLHLKSGFPDPDSFYHIKMAQIMHDQGLMESFDWLSFTTLSDHFTNHHLLYHIFLSLWLFIFPPLFAMKFVTVLLSSLMVVCFYNFLRINKISFPFLYTLLLISNANFIFRLNLGKSVALSLIFFILFLIVLFEKRLKYLFLLSFLYVWMYAGFIILLPVSFLFFLSEYITSYFEKKQIKKSVIVKNALFVGSYILIGIVLGIIIHPYFPDNVHFFYQQIIEIALINKGSVISVGMEWNPYDTKEFLLSNLLICFFYLISLVIFTLHAKTMNKKVWSIGLLSLSFLVLTLKSQRYIEYFIPIVLIFCAFTVEPFLKIHNCKDVYAYLLQWYASLKRQALKIVFLLLIFYAVISFFFYIGKNYYFTYQAYQDTFSEERFKGASLWLKKHSQKGDIVFHTSFDEFPLLFYHNDVNSYITGLDPTFFYNKDKEKFLLWNELVLGKRSDHLYNVIMDEFHAKYILISNDWPKMKPHLMNDPNITPVYTDDYATIYQMNLP